jgi:hypothetical protein
MRATRLVLLLATLLPAGACVAPPASESPVPRVTASPGSAEYALQRAQARDWSVRLITLHGDTLIGHVTTPAPGRVRIRASDLSLQDVTSIERRAIADGSRAGTVALASVLVGGLAGTLAFLVHAGDSPCDHCEMRGFFWGGAAGLAAWIAVLRGQERGRWVTLWSVRRESPATPR